MKTVCKRMVGIVSTVMTTVSAQAEWQYGLYPECSSNVWIGATEALWTDGMSWSDGQIVTNGANRGHGSYAVFTNSDPVTVYFNVASGARGVIVDRGAGQVVFHNTNYWGSSRFTLGMNNLDQGNNRASVVNNSDHHVIFDIPTRFGGLSYGKFGLYPGVEFNSVFEAQSGSGSDLVCFLPGDSGLSEYRNTTVFKGDTNLKNHGAVIYSNHLVRQQGHSFATTGTVTVADGGRFEVLQAELSCTNLVTEGSGSVLLSNVTVNATSLVGNMMIAGETVLNQTGQAVTLGGLSFAPEGTLRLNRSGPVSFVDETTRLSRRILTESLVYSTKASGDIKPLNEDVCWSDGASAQPDREYVVDTRSSAFGGSGVIRTSDQDAKDYTFPGKSLTLIGQGEKPARFMQKCRTIEITNLVLLAHAYYELGGHNGSLSEGRKIHTFAGVLTVDGGESSVTGAASSAVSRSAAINTSDTGRYLALKGSLAGAGDLRIYCSNSGKTNMGVDLTRCDNVAYVGALRLEGAAETLLVDTPSGVGGNPAKVSPKGLELVGGTLVFANTAEMTIDQPNRGLYVEGSATLETRTTDVAWRGPIAFSGSMARLTKIGTGTLILEGTNTSAVGTIDVSAGSVAAGSPFAVGCISVSGKGVLPSLVAEPGARKIAETDLVLVPDGDAAETPAANLARVTERGWSFATTNYGLNGSWRVTLSQVAVDGGVMIRASAKKSGLVVLFR